MDGSIKAAFHDTVTDILVRILAMKSRVSDAGIGCMMMMMMMIKHRFV